VENEEQEEVEQPQKLKPVFVSKTDRETLAERDTLYQEEVIEKQQE
jgi:hypothetical protein